jgi:hypothetical protein
MELIATACRAPDRVTMPDAKVLLFDRGEAVAVWLSIPTKPHEVSFSRAAAPTSSARVRWRARRGSPGTCSGISCSSCIAVGGGTDLEADLDPLAESYQG